MGVTLSLRRKKVYENNVDYGNCIIPENFPEVKKKFSRDCSRRFSFLTSVIFSTLVTKESPPCFGSVYLLIENEYYCRKNDIIGSSVYFSLKSGVKKETFLQILGNKFAEGYKKNCRLNIHE